MLISKSNLIASLSTVKKSHGDDATDFDDKQIPMVGSNHVV